MKSMRTENVEQNSLIDGLPAVRGRYTENAKLGEMGWFRAGGVAEVMFKPADREDLIYFLKHYCHPEQREGSRASQGDSSSLGAPQNDIHIFGVLSNCIIRDGGLRGVTIRLGREFAQVEQLDDVTIRAGALALDGTVAKFAADHGIAGLEFYSGIPGTIGGALRMNAGCYGTETKDVLVEVEALDRQGNVHVFRPSGARPYQFVSSPRKRGSPDQERESQTDSRLRGNDIRMEMNLSYRHNDLPDGFIFLSATLRGERGDPEAIKSRIQEIKTKRIESQPIKEKTGGSTFANPAPEDIAAAGLPEGTKVWQLIDRAGCRGLQIGGAQMSEKHCNFMINTGNATGADLENLGEEVRRRVYEDSGIRLRWEIRRIGEAIDD